MLCCLEQRLAAIGFIEQQTEARPARGDPCVCEHGKMLERSDLCARSSNCISDFF
jgi:hypothetical protein